MNPGVLFILTSDPRTSPRPAEAVRIAAGVGVWQKVDVTVYLHGDAILALGESPDGLVDEENFVQYWPVIAGWGRPVYVQKNAAAMLKISPSRVPFEEIADKELAALAARQTYVMRF
jgi:hypothetical protein